MREHGWPLLGCTLGYRWGGSVDPGALLRARMPTESGCLGCCHQRVGGAEVIDAEKVEPTDWLARHHAARADGYHLDFLTGSDDGECTQVASRLLAETAEHWLTTRVCAESLESITSVFPSADWHERELAEMFNVSMSGRSECLPLLGAHRGVMRKSVLLQPRLDIPWPGSAEPEDDGRQGANPSRRRLRPPGVPEERGRG